MSLSRQVDRCLIIPDVHQDLAWLDRILAQETEADLYVFLGDYFDPHGPAKLCAGVTDTCRRLDELREQLGSRALFLLGNHDIQYLEARPVCLGRRVPRHLQYHCGSAFKYSAAAKIAKRLSAEFWRETRLFIQVNGWLLSHAGVHRQFWPECPTIAESLTALDEACQGALELIAHRSSPLLHAGFVRGGEQPCGGITWQDWNEEFLDDLPCAQIVGHTSSSDGARQLGRSWCLDGGQTCYGCMEGTQLHVRQA